MPERIGKGQDTQSDSSHTSSAADQKSTELAALRLLARREHSVEELRRKLGRQGHARASIDVVIDQLSARKLISDARFAGSMVRHRSQRGQGPVRIRAELQRLGVEQELIQAEFEEEACDWSGLAARVRSRKFGESLPRSGAERAKQARFLQYRGFTADQIRAALGFDAASDGSGMDADFRSNDPEPDC